HSAPPGSDAAPRLGDFTPAQPAPPGGTRRAPGADAHWIIRPDRATDAGRATTGRLKSRLSQQSRDRADTRYVDR
ncbi:MAG TPA: hypothetical protein VII33_04115, partial [Nakamurella sp.]